MKKAIVFETFGVLFGVAGVGALIGGCVLSHATRSAGTYEMSMTLVPRDAPNRERHIVSTAQPTFNWPTATVCEGGSVASIEDIWKRRVQQRLGEIASGAAGTMDERLQFAGRDWCAADITERWRFAVMDPCTAPVGPSAMPIERCRGVSDARFEADPVQIRFPDTAAGASASVTLTLRNPGSATLVVQPPDVEWHTMGFHFHEGADPGRDCFRRTPISVPAGEWCQMRISFDPVMAGYLSDYLRFDTNDSNLVNRVPLGGFAVR